MATTAELASNSANIPPSRQNTPGIRRESARETVAGDGTTLGAKRDGGRRGRLRFGPPRPGRGGERESDRGEGHPDGKNGSDEAVGGKNTAGGTDSKAGPSRRTRRGPQTQKPSGNESSSPTNNNAAQNAASSKDAPTLKQQARPPHRKRAAKFNPGLTEKSPGQSIQVEASEKYRRTAPKQDDLTSTLIYSLAIPPYRDCLICFSAIRPFEPTWSCSSLIPTSPGSDDEKDGVKEPILADVGTQCCWTPFHLKCIQQWASKSVKEVADAWRARGEDRPGSWRCPGCQSKRLNVPNGYWCFCGSVVDPKPPRLATPHSCAANCSRPRTCGHACPLPCHPGPCPPCQVTVQQPCFCGRNILSFRCSFVSSETKRDHLSSFSCGKTCDKKLGCGNHACQDICHDGPCSPCTVTEIAGCYCGKEEKEIACGEGSPKDSVIDTGAGAQRWVGRFACEETCDRLYDCGIHRCEKPCHPQSAPTTLCPRSPSLVTHCPCGKHELSASSALAFSPGINLNRTVCTDAIPTCQSVCMRPLDGCSHVCSSRCHAGPCPPCSLILVRPCRCGATTHNVRCSDERMRANASDGNAEKEILCSQACTVLRACGKHQCNRICCPLASLAGASKGRGKKKAAAALIFEGTDEAGWHECDLVCGKMLGCGNHSCEAKDHKGLCRPCMRYSYEEIICHCGRTVLEPPIPCATRIVCSYQCSRPPPACGHSKAPHHCHEDPVPCPPCVLLTQKRCACGKKMVDNVRCSQETVSCGTTCGKLLACGFHHCERLCHSDGCGPCNAACGKPRKLCLPALHPCTMPCHAPATCSEAEPCRAIVNIICPCGRIVQPVPCGRSISSPGGREGSQQLKCSNECLIAKRNARLAEALGISGDNRSDNRSQATYHDSLISFARVDSNFCAMVEKSLADFITSEKKSQILPHMHPSRRKFVHDLAAVYRMDTQMVDQEPNRSVELIRRIDSRIPSPTLSSTIASTPPSSTNVPSSHGLGKLADLRAPSVPRSIPGRSWNVSPAPSAASGSRAWTSVVTRPHTTPSPTPVASAGAWGNKPAALPERSREAYRPPASRLVQLSATTTPSAPVQDPNGEDVPDNWEDDT